MPAIQNVERRGAVYYWRRTVCFHDGKPFTLRLSLRTTNHAVARRLGCALTAKSEMLKVTLATRPPVNLSALQKAQIFREQLEYTRDELDRTHVTYQQNDPDDATYMIIGYVELLEVMLKDFIVHGFPSNAGTRQHVDERLGQLSEEQRDNIVWFFEMDPDPRQRWMERARKDVERFGAAETDENLAIARKVRLEGWLSGVQEFRKRLSDPASLWSQFAPVEPIAAATPTPTPTPTSALDALSEPTISEPWASMTPTQAAARFIIENPKILGDAKRQARWTDKTRRQFLSAVSLLEKSFGAQPLRLLTRESIMALNAHFGRLPTSHHKPERHKNMTLEEICAEAAAEVLAKTRPQQSIGLSATTTNRHFLFLKELMTWFAKHVPNMPEIDWVDFLYEDRRDARKQRDAYTEEEGRAMFRLPIWIGSRSISRRLDAGSEIYHDAGYWVPIIAWYTGCRREEICQLTLDDIGEIDGIWYLTVTDENGGRLKNQTSKRDVPFAQELIRLGLPGYVKALRSAGENMLFPALRTELNNRQYGDVYYKNWWTKMSKQLDFLEPGQALQSFRHTVTTELKHQQVFLETRADLVGC